MAEYEVTKMEGVDETDPEISFKVRVPSDALLVHGSAQADPFGRVHLVLSCFSRMTHWVELT